MGRASRGKRDRPPWSRDIAVRKMISRLEGHAALVEQLCPGALAEPDQLHSATCPRPDWPTWCWVPTRISDAVAAQHVRWDLAVDMRSGLAETTAFVSAWHQGKGIYRISADFAMDLEATAMPDSLPGDVLLQFPEWCAYLVLEPVPGLLGAYVRLDWDGEAEQRPVLALLFDVVPESEPDKSILTSLKLSLDCASLSSALAELLSASDDAAHGTQEDLETIARVARPFIAAALYLCSIGADIASNDRGASRPYRASGLATTARVWDVGYRIAELLRQKTSRATGSGSSKGTSPAAHLRRAHWHTYVVGRGARANPSNARRELRWLHPMIIGAGQVVPVVRTINKERSRLKRKEQESQAS